MLFTSALGQPSLAILPFLRACTTIISLNQVHAQIIRLGFEQDHYLITQFISMCTTLKPNHLAYPRRVFDSVTNPNIYLWNVTIKAHCDGCCLNECFVLFNRMRGVFSPMPDEYTFTSLIKVCCNSVDLKKGRVVHGMSLKCGIDRDVFVGSSLVDFYGKCGEVLCANKVFDEMPLRNEVTWTAMMVAYLSCGNFEAGKLVFDKMPKRTEGTWNAMIKGLVKYGDLTGARKLFDAMPKRSEVSYTTLIDGYAKVGDMEAARSLFDELPNKDLFAWSALMTGYVQNGKPGEALRVFSQMSETGLKADEFVMVSLMSACAQLGSSELAKWIESHLRNGSFDLKRAHFRAALVDMNAKCGNMERASSLFEEMPEKDLISYCSMLQGLCIHGQGDKAVQLFDRMIKEGTRPDDVAFTVILNTCSHAGLVDDGCRYFDLMINKYAISPSPDHYACMVNLLGKSGKLEPAYDLIRSMPVESHTGAWGALLGACALHCDAKLGKVVASRLFKLEPRSAGNYVLLSNIYAGSNRWSCVSRLRETMSERGVRKIPGCSFLESD